MYEKDALREWLLFSTLRFSTLSKIETKMRWYYVRIKAMMPNKRYATAIVRIAAANKREAKALAGLETIKSKPNIRIKRAIITTSIL